jgi:hypothetical protein
MDQVLAIAIGVLILIPCAVYGVSAIRRERATPDDPQPDQDETAPAAEGASAPSYTVEQTFTQRVTNVALTWVRQSISGGAGADGKRRTAISSGPAGGNSSNGPDGSIDDAQSPRNAGTRTGRASERDNAPTWVDAEVIRETPPQPTALQRAARRALPWLRSDDPQPAQGTSRPAETRPPAPPHAEPAPPASDVQVEDVKVDVQRDIPDLQPLTAAEDRPAVTGAPLTIDPAPVALEGVDMSQAPLVPSGDGSAVRLATAGQLRSALATGGFSRLMEWLRAFRKASNNTLAQANEMHAQALLVARRTRSAYLQALQAFQAVQSDKLDRQMIQRTWEMLERTQAQAAAAAQLTRATAAFVVASGGQQPAVAAAVQTLQRHAPIAAAIQASPVEPVKNLDWYRQ